jgi:Tol biopolymer transport system component
MGMRRGILISLTLAFAGIAGATVEARPMTAAGLAQTPEGTDVLSIQLDGSGRRNLTHNDGLDYSPALSRDGRQVVFVRSNSEIQPVTSASVYLMRVDGSRQRRVKHGGVASEPTWSPRGGRIAFSLALGGSCGPPPPGQPPTRHWLAVVGPDGQRLQRIALGAVEPTWSPDGSRLAYTSVDRRSVLSGIGVVRLSNRKRSRLVRGTFGRPAWSPKGNQIAYVELRGELALWVANAEGGARRRVATGLRGDIPAWSPDGRRIAFVNSASEIVVRSLSGGSKRITPTPALASSPVWSPDGGSIAFVQTKLDSGKGQVYVVHRDGTGLRAITSERHGVIAVNAWSPDGRTLIYTARTPGQPRPVC